MASEDSRAKAIVDWLENGLRMPIERIEPASSDASFRRYFRVSQGQRQFIVMDAPADKENLPAFIKVAKLFAWARINVPDIYRQNLTHGFLLLQDFGNLCFLDALHADSASGLYRSALDSLFRLQYSIDIDSCGLPAYDEALLARELGIFQEWYLQKYARITLTQSERQIIADTWSFLQVSALQQPRVCVHRDYHSRNLMVTAENPPGVLDFQDAVIGPVTYDLVSLLRDCYIAWPEHQVDSWMLDYYQRLRNQGIVSCSADQFRLWFDLMGMQRHLKAVGIFARLYLRDAKPDYLDDIPRTMQYVKQVCSRYVELSDFLQLLHSHRLPIQYIDR